MNKVAAFALRRKNSILSMSEKMFCPPQPLRFWITPARAGKSECNSSSNDARWDHPRVCGEKHKCRGRGCCREGSPPRMRGKVEICLFVRHTVGITPAHAGKRQHQLPGGHGQRDHPRACGEKLLCICPLFCAWGSPPRMRGKVIRWTTGEKSLGITPAHAGKRRFR